MSCFIDTNILIYAKLNDPKEQFKRLIAGEILRRRDCILSIQVVQEFYVQAIRANRPGGINPDLAAELIEQWSRFRIEDLTMATFRRAHELKQRYHYSYWDCAILAAALTAGCDTLFTEDLHHGQVIDGLQIVNPFKDN